MGELLEPRRAGSQKRYTDVVKAPELGSPSWNELAQRALPAIPGP